MSVYFLWVFFIVSRFFARLHTSRLSVLRFAVAYRVRPTCMFFFFPRRYFSVCGIAIGTVVGIARAGQQSIDGSWFQATMNKFMQWPVSSGDWSGQWSFLFCSAVDRRLHAPRCLTLRVCHYQFQFKIAPPPLLAPSPLSLWSSESHLCCSSWLRGSSNFQEWISCGSACKHRRRSVMSPHSLQIFCLMVPQFWSVWSLMFSALVLKLLNKYNRAMSDLFSLLKLIGTSGRLVRIF